ncbi:hypothetical protein [Nocardiopsis alborubida]|uniref:Uncharacterized protein n=1 Tax=Nocardiopsis alborubida TaxID=146802 RepID=A0A7X6RTJ0_9ACTN|nr:hypothetical protein [Nocardiopsis alborubida]NKZ01438.1 hypothetical protein [Nocardiopsis alborubida]
MEHPIGRHRRPRQSLAGRVWALTAAVLAIALAYMFVPQHHRRPGPEQTAITPSPRRRELPPALVPAERRPVQELTGFPSDQVRSTRTVPTSSRGQSDRHTQAPRPRPGNEASPSLDSDAGTLVRPYMPPFPRIPVGDLLAEPVGERTDDLSDLAAVIRVYLDRVG